MISANFEKFSFFVNSLLVQGSSKRFPFSSKRKYIHFYTFRAKKRSAAATKIQKDTLKTVLFLA
jgi:hypothetical protein